MAIYRINQKNGIFKGFPGEIVVAEPGPLMDAAVKSGILTRQADEQLPLPIVEDLPAPDKKSKKKRSDDDHDS